MASTAIGRIGNVTSSGDPRLCREALERIGGHGVRYGLVAVLVWIGAMKFTAYEAQAIAGLVANSPLLSWIYSLLSVPAASAWIGLSELVIAVLIAARPLSPTLAAAGSALAVGMFLTTLSFLVSTPGAFEPSAGGFPALSVLPGQFLIKDVVLLAAAVWSFAEAWNARARSQTAPDARTDSTTSLGRP